MGGRGKTLTSPKPTLKQAQNQCGLHEIMPQKIKSKANVCKSEMNTILGHLWYLINGTAIVISFKYKIKLFLSRNYFSIYIYFSIFFATYEIFKILPSFPPFF